jgi:hypothetical protein
MAIPDTRLFEGGGVEFRQKKPANGQIAFTAADVCFHQSK